jgi:hypothetical protein
VPLGLAADHCGLISIMMNGGLCCEGCSDGQWVGVMARVKRERAAENVEQKTEILPFLYLSKCHKRSDTPPAWLHVISVRNDPP